MKLEHIPRWIKASVDKHMDDLRGIYHLFIEGQDRDTKDKTDYFELRMDGPYRTQYSNNEFEFYVEINIELTCSINEKDAHVMQRMFGQTYLMFTPCITVFKYGDGPDDNQQLLGNLIRIDDAESKGTEVSNFGQIDPALPLMQGTVEAHYKMYLCEG